MKRSTKITNYIFALTAVYFGVSVTLWGLEGVILAYLFAVTVASTVVLWLVVRNLVETFK